MKHLFWISVVFVGYAYFGYPLLLRLWVAVAGRPVRKRPAQSDRIHPSVSVVIAARNEAARLPRRIRNLLQQNYPLPLDIIVVSDGSSDDTRAAVAAFRQVRLIEVPRGGKALALNAGVAAARGDIVVFADARQLFAPEAISELISNFDDPEVGCVTGELILDCEILQLPPSSGVDDGIGLYWRYEKWLRRIESQIWSTLGATGAIYALRRSLWRPLPPSTLLDDVLAPMRVVLANKRTVFEPAARAYDRATPSASAETRRKVRTLAGNYQILQLEPRLLDPFSNPVWLQYFSHKIARLLVPWALVSTLVSSAFLAASGWVYLLTLMLQLGFYVLAALGGWMNRNELVSAATAESAEASETMNSWDSVYTGRSAG
jgi:biofilm PGA synthesis N-glycosyltransferase PgaC